MAEPAVGYSPPEFLVLAQQAEKPDKDGAAKEQLAAAAQTLLPDY